MPTVSDPNVIYPDKKAAADALIDLIPKEIFDEHETVVIGVSEAGVYYADALARYLRCDFDILLTEPIYAPNNPELAIAMISETEEVVLHEALVDAFGINEDFIFSEAQRKYEEEVLGYVYRYRKGKELVDLKGKYVVLVDECVETGLTMMAALKSTINREAKNIYIATPVLDKSVFQNLLSVCDGVFCPRKIDDYISVEYYFETYETPSYEAIMETIRSHEEQKENNE